MSDIITSSKLSLLRHLKLEQCVTAKTAESIMRLIIKHGKIESLDVSDNKLSLVESHTMGQLIRRVTKLVAKNCRLTNSQLEKIFRVIDEDEECRIKVLMIGNNNLSGIKFHHLGAAVCKLSSLHCDNCHLSSPQVTNILTSLSSETENCQLEDLNLMLNSLLAIDHTLIASGLARLRTLNLWGTDAICFSLFSKMSEGNSKLEELNLGNSDLSYYPPALVTSSVLSLKAANLSHVTMSSILLNMLLSSVVCSNQCNLQSLVMLNILSTEQSAPQDLLDKVRERIPTFEISFV